MKISGHISVRIVVHKGIKLSYLKRNIAVLSPRPLSFFCSKNIQIFAEPLSGVGWVQDFIDESSLGGYEWICKSKESVERKREKETVVSERHKNNCVGRVRERGEAERENDNVTYATKRDSNLHQHIRFLFTYLHLYQ